MWRSMGRARRLARAGSALLLVIAISALAAGCGDSASSSTTAQGDRFDAAKAWRLIERQLAAGQRPAGSPQLRKLATELRPLLPDAHFEPIPGQPGLRNIVGVLPGQKPAIVLGAHYDTLAKPRGFVGANNGAAGTAIVIEAAQALRSTKSEAGDREVRFVLFDGEEPPAELPEESPHFYNEGLRGSRAYVAAHPGETASMILLDYVGNRGLLLDREVNSTPALWQRVLIAADTAGASNLFSSEARAEVTDDHTPFLRSGVPAVDLIDWRYPGHDVSDRLDKLSRQSVDGVGETIVQLVEEVRAEK